MTQDEKINTLTLELKSFYALQNLPFHGWHHIYFVTKKAKEFAKSINANIFLVESASLTHDLNYAVKPNSEPISGKKLRQKFLLKSGFSKEEIKKIEKIVIEEHTKTRGQNNNLSDEGKALSDADTLFKVLPVTPILFANKYIAENKIDLKRLARKICDEQNNLMSQGIYFYTDLAKKRYIKWAKNNLDLWNNVLDALEDKDIQDIMSSSNNKQKDK